MKVKNPELKAYFVTHTGIAVAPAGVDVATWTRVRDVMYAPKHVTNYMVLAECRDRAAHNVGQVMALHHDTATRMWVDRYDPAQEYEIALNTNPPNALQNYEYHTDIEEVYTPNYLERGVRVVVNVAVHGADVKDRDNIVIGIDSLDPQKAIELAVDKLIIENPKFFNDDPHEDSASSVVFETSSVASYLDIVEPSLAPGVSMSIVAYVVINPNGLLLRLPDDMYFNAFQSHWGQRRW